MSGQLEWAPTEDLVRELRGRFDLLLFCGIKINSEQSQEFAFAKKRNDYALVGMVSDLRTQLKESIRKGALGARRLKT